MYSALPLNYVGPNSVSYSPEDRWWSQVHTLSTDFCGLYSTSRPNRFVACFCIPPSIFFFSSTMLRIDIPREVGRLVFRKSWVRSANKVLVASRSTLMTARAGILKAMKFKTISPVRDLACGRKMSLNLPLRQHGNIGFFTRPVLKSLIPNIPTCLNIYPSQSLVNNDLCSWCK